MKQVAFALLALGIAACGTGGIPSQNGSEGFQNKATVSAWANAPPKTIVGIVNPDGSLCTRSGKDTLWVASSDLAEFTTPAERVEPKVRG
jgi:hypothetical protein